jgi:hypothetical protein
VRAEEASRRVELVADEADFAALARARGADPAAFLQSLRKAGVTSLGVAEDTLQELDAQGLATVRSGPDLLASVRLGGLDPALLGGRPVETSGVYAVVDDGALADWLRRQLAERLGAAAVTSWPAGGRFVVLARGDPRALETLGLGFRPGRLAALARAGFRVVPRWENDPRLSAVAIQDEVRRAAAEAPLHTVIFAGDQALGYPDRLDAMAAAVVRQGLTVGVVETAEQRGNVDRGGLRALDALDGERTVRVFSVPAWMFLRLTPPGIVLSVAEGVAERNLRVVYLHPDPRGPDPLQGNVALWSDLAATLRRRGFTLGPAEPFPPVTVRLRQRLPMVLGAAAAGLALLHALLPGTRRARWGVAVGAAAGLAAIASTQLSRQAAALLVAVALPSLASLHVASLWGRRIRGWRQAASAAATVAALALAGGAYVAGLLGDTPYLLEWSYFRGVKVTFLVPPLVAAAAGAAALRGKGLARSLREVGEEVVRARHLALAGVVLAAAGLYLFRSGNVSITAVPALELRLRHFLEQSLAVRPREKEFLVGYPSLFLAAWAASRGWAEAFLVFLLGASAAPVSVVDSFEHLRTPFGISLLRSVYGLAAGVALGSLALGAARGLERLWHGRTR